MSLVLVVVRADAGEELRGARRDRSRLRRRAASTRSTFAARQTGLVAELAESSPPIPRVGRSGGHRRQPAVHPIARRRGVGRRRRAATARRATPSCRRSISRSCGMPIVRGRGFRAGRGARSAPRGDRQRRHRPRVLARAAIPIGQPIRDRTPRGAAGRRAARLHRGHGRRHHQGRRQRHDVRRARRRAHLSAGARRGSARHRGAGAPPRVRPTSAPTCSRRSSGAPVPDPEVFEALPLEEMRDTQMYPLRAAAWIGSLLGAIALRAERLGPLRRAVVHAEPADAGDRHPHGARRDAPAPSCAS